MLQRIVVFIEPQGAVPGIQLAHAGRKAPVFRAREVRPGTVSEEEGGWRPVVTQSAIASLFLSLSVIFLSSISSLAQEVTPLEDLMREHGVLRRVLLIYEAQLSGEKGYNYAVIIKSAGIVRDFIENYHEKLEEDYIFPIFEKTGEYRELVKILRQQHAAGRKLTAAIIESAKNNQTGDKKGGQALSRDLRLFIRMYRPHAAREDTALFPALQGLLYGKAYEALGDKFENKERELFGEGGFKKKVKAVADLEKELKIYDLSGFTPSAS